MRYLMLICSDEQRTGSMSEAEGSAILAEYGKFMQEMEQRGVLRGGERLRPTTEATTVRVQNGKVLTSDGPFAETKEQLGGYFMVDCKNHDEAVEIASKIPAARMGAIEVMPIWEMESSG
jgi:hypothetical protein